MTEKLTRIAIVSADKCKPKRCLLECKKTCPVVRMGQLCIEVNKGNKRSQISETLCIGCGICVKKCPFGAISIINLPKSLEKNTVHRYGPNSFKLHRLPIPRQNQVLGLVGTNGIGKSTALKILAGKIKCNLGNVEIPPSWDDILVHFRGSELQSYFTNLLQDQLLAVIKPQYVEEISKIIKGNVGVTLSEKDELGTMDEIVKILDLGKVLDRNISELSGGELQRFAIAIVSMRNADILMYDEPSSYLDVSQRLKAAQVIRRMLHRDKVYVIVVEHDLSILDYSSHCVCCLYGIPGAYGVITLPFSVREGINIFLDGFIPTENLRFRDESLVFRVTEIEDEEENIEKHREYKYRDMKKTMGSFTLRVKAGKFTDGEIIVLLGQNGTGKTTLIRMLAGKLKPDDSTPVPELKVSYKPQMISPHFKGTVKQLLYNKIQQAFIHPQFQTEVIKPMTIEPLFDRKILDLSGGELQRVALVLALGQPADVYLIDEPSAYLDSEQRIITSRVIKRFILHAKKTAFIVEHDFIMATYLADRVIVYDGEPSINCIANAPVPLVVGMNKFLNQLDITFRRDPDNFRPRINKLDSIKDKEQKSSGNFFFAD